MIIRLVRKLDAFDGFISEALKIKKREKEKKMVRCMKWDNE